MLEEADQFAPQKLMGNPDAARMLGAVEDLVRRGRGRGIGISLVTQRSAVVNKDVLTQTECLVALRTTHKRDRATIEEWIETHGEEEETKTVLSSLPGLPIGTAWFWSPGWLGVLTQVRIRERETFDSSATPKAGESKRVPKTVADVDLGALKEQMSETIEKAKSEDPKELHRRIRHLEKELRTRPAAEPEEVEIEVPVEVPVLDKKDRDHIWAVLKDLGAQFGRIEEQLDSRGIPRTAAVPTRNTKSTKSQGSTPKRRPARDIARPEPGEDEDLKIKAGARRMLEVLARHHPMKVTKPQLATLAKMKVSGGTFQTYYSKLKRHDLITENGSGLIEISDAGFDYVGAVPDEPMTADEIREMWRSKLKAGARRMLDVLVDFYPDAVERERLAELVEMTETGGTFQTYLSTLRRNGLAEFYDDGVRASDTLFIGAGA